MQEIKLILSKQQMQNFCKQGEPIEVVAKVKFGFVREEIKVTIEPRRET